MSLTGPWFFGLLVLVTAGAFGAAVYFWPRLAGRSPLSLLARAGTLLGLNLAVLLTAAVALNNQFTFFADWTDLAGALGRTQNVTTAHRGATPADAAAAPLTGSLPTPSTMPAQPATSGLTQRILKYTVTGPLSGITAEVMVGLPAGYADAANQNVRYPVLETFHGYPGAVSQWLGSMDLGGAIDSAVAQHKMSDVVIVSPTIEVPAGRDTECVNGNPGDPQVETWLTQDVPNWMAQTFRVRTDRSGWATIGLSAGAWCAAMATMLHPDRYSAGIVLGGYFTPSFLSYKPFGPNSPQFRRYDLIAAAQNSPPPVALWVQTSHSDPISYPSSSKLLAAARPPLSVTSVVLAHAGHRLSLWQDLLPQVFQWLGSNIHGFAPAH
ncbi:MAG TPA: alpha/beta hydrolase-fold protein [Kineosporiaceae bacterium]|nr:alpha/beta hydrolase-fold protein [Kineosporiaceae bacterium]